MLRAQRIIWMGEWSVDDKKHKKKFGHYPKWSIVEYRTKDSDLPCYINREEYEVYLKEKEIVDMARDVSEDFRTALFEKVEAYGEARRHQGYQDALENVENY